MPGRTGELACVSDDAQVGYVGRGQGANNSTRQRRRNKEKHKR